MTLKELYAEIGGDYDSGIKVLRLEKLMDKHIRKLPANGIFKDIDEAGQAMDGVRLFESAHAIKGVCANLGLKTLAALAEKICEEFREGNQRKMTDDEVCGIIAEIDELFRRSAEGISRYASGE